MLSWTEVLIAAHQPMDGLQTLAQRLVKKVFCLWTGHVWSQLKVPAAADKEAVACIFSLEGELLSAFQGKSKAVDLIKLLCLPSYRPPGCRLVGTLHPVPHCQLLGVNPALCSV